MHAMFPRCIRSSGKLFPHNVDMSLVFVELHLWSATGEAKLCALLNLESPAYRSRNGRSTSFRA